MGAFPLAKTYIMRWNHAPFCVQLVLCMVSRAELGRGDASAGLVIVATNSAIAIAAPTTDLCWYERFTDILPSILHPSHLATAHAMPRRAPCFLVTSPSSRPVWRQRTTRLTSFGL